MPPLTPDAKRLRTIIITFPLLVVTSAILYRRAFLGEEQRTIPKPGDQAMREPILGRGPHHPPPPSTSASAAWGEQGKDPWEQQRAPNGQSR